ncbi:hypothetical protein GCM10010485_04120 [Streptosporangium carneum]
MGIAALIATASLAAPSAASAHTAGARTANSASAVCAQDTNWTTYAQVSCTGTSLSYRVEAQYCRPGSCTWHNGPWVSGGAWSTVSGFSGGGFNTIQYRFA